ncbi:M50 family metallopeptidase [Candidatus Saccharibacteria bacterium]|nr:M50 family metallopeptidase [Candidatus Saccharibacteria bacterium]
MTLGGILVLVAQIIGGLILLTIIVVVHELGHYFNARRNGIEVEEFGIGFPPLAYKRKLKNGVIFSLNWIPIGGFCRVKGENSTDKRKGTYGAASFQGKTQFLLGGISFNLAFAAVVFTILSLFGMPKLIPDQFHVLSDNHEILGPVEVAHVVEGSVAQENNIKVGDRLVSLDGTPIIRSVEFPALTAAHRGETVDLVIERDDQTITKTLTLGDGTDGRGALGVSAFSEERNRATWSAPLVGIGVTVQLTRETFRGLGTMLGNLFGGIIANIQGIFGAGDGNGGARIAAAGDGLAGPIGIIGILFPGAFVSGPSIVILLVGVISLSLAVMNLLPIPALDGGRWLMALYTKITKKEISKKTEEKIIVRGFMVLIGLIALTVILDIWRLAT